MSNTGYAINDPKILKRIEKEGVAWLTNHIDKDILRKVKLHLKKKKDKK